MLKHVVDFSITSPTHEEEIKVNKIASEPQGTVTYHNKNLTIIPSLGLTELLIFFLM